MRALSIFRTTCHVLSICRVCLRFLGTCFYRAGRPLERKQASRAVAATRPESGLANGVTVCHWKPQDSRGIRGFAWSPNSRSIAVLNTSNNVGKGPLELLSALSGHPVPHDTVFLDIMDVQTRKVVEYVVRKDVVSSFTRILKWSE